MEYDLPRARNVDAAPVAMYWTARTRSFLPRPVTRDRLLVAYLVGNVPYGTSYNCTCRQPRIVRYVAAGVPIQSNRVTYSWYTPCSKHGFEEHSRTT
eukprot:scaffold2753_cov55-Attheya_sp.AAC.1